jgi:integrase
MKTPTKTVRTRLADGTLRVYRYNRATGQRIGAPSTERQADDRYPPNSLGHGLALYERSLEYQRLAPGSRQAYQRALRLLDPLLAYDAAAVRRRHLIELRDAVASSRGPGAANIFTSTARTLYSWLMQRWDLDFNPAADIKPMPIGAFPAWTEEQAAVALEKFEEHVRRAVVLAYHLGQRRSDLVSLTWAEYNGETVHLVQKKTGHEMWLPVTPELRRELDAWRRTTSSTHILTDAQGRPWRTQTALSCAVRRAAVRAGLPDGLNLHGLRKLLCRRLKLAGASIPEIASISGHRNWGLVQRYADGADQQVLATAAVALLATRNKARSG